MQNVLLEKLQHLEQIINQQNSMLQVICPVRITKRCLNHHLYSFSFQNTLAWFKNVFGFDDIFVSLSQDQCIVIEEQRRRLDEIEDRI